MRSAVTWALIVWLTTTQTLLAQGDPTTGIGTAAVGTAGAGGAVSTAGTVGATGSGGINLWSFLCPTADQLQKLRKKFCSCALGQMINAVLVPIETYTGGLIHADLCPPKDKANPADLAKPADSAEGAAARIKAKEAQCAAKAEAVRYLATVNCDYYPEAEKALIASLRTDECECVRLEAARALATGCCCTKATIAALVLTVNADTKDGGPPECSERVKAMALIALNKCLQCYREPAPKQPERPDAPNKDKAKAGLSYFQQYYANLQTGPTLAEARAVLVNAPRSLALPIATSTGQRSLSGIVNAASRTTPSTPTALSTPTAPPTPLPRNSTTDSPEPAIAAQHSPALLRVVGSPTPFVQPSPSPTSRLGTATPSAPPRPTVPPSGQRSLSQIWQHANRP